MSQAHQHMANDFYLQARRYLELTENEGNIASTHALQTNILIALFELRHANFARAWTSVSRLTWLTRMLDLHQMDDSTELNPEELTRSLFSLTDPVELEERRRTLWATVHLNCFLNMGIKWAPGMVINLAEVTTRFCTPFRTLTGSR